MKTKLLIALLTLNLSLVAQTNLISYFEWNNNPVSQADFGPNATSISASAFSDANGANSTNGLNAGNPKQDIDLILPGSFYDVDGIEVSIDYQREENTGYFFLRGNSLRFGISSGQLRVQYRLNDGLGGYVQYVYTNLYNVPSDDVYRNYTFRYDPTTGEAQILVDGNVIWNKFENVQPLYWNGSGNMIIGSGLDGTGYGNTFLDNARISEVVGVVLPVEFQIVSVVAEHGSPLVKWETNFEKNNSHFLVEKSKDGENFKNIGLVEGAGNSNTLIEYSFLDEEYNEGEKVFYRINQVDNERENFFSKILSYFSDIKITQLTKVYPTLLNQPNQELTLEFQSKNDLPINLSVYSINGQLLSSKTLHINKGNNLIFFESNIENKGNYILVAENDGKIFSSKLVY